MRIDHIAIWVSDLERMKWFYEKYFGAIAGDGYYESVVLDPEGNRIEMTV